MLLTKEGQAAKEAFNRYEIQGTPEGTNDEPPWRAPWYLIDVSQHQFSTLKSKVPHIPVDWLGEVVAEYANSSDADNHFWNLIGAAVKGDK